VFFTILPKKVTEDALYLAQFLELIPVACIGEILVFIASNMIKASEIKEVKLHGKFEFAMM
jgi:sulfate permease, SulP family